jgi:hypothetical protein
MPTDPDNADAHQVRVDWMIKEFREAQGRRRGRTDHRPELPAREQPADGLVQRSRAEEAASRAVAESNARDANKPPFRP